MLVNKVATTDTPAKTLNTPSQPKLVIIPYTKNTIHYLELYVKVVIAFPEWKKYKMLLYLGK